jgi:hypothetical protein
MIVLIVWRVTKKSLFPCQEVESVAAHFIYKVVINCSKYNNCLETRWMNNYLINDITHTG